MDYIILPIGKIIVSYESESGSKYSFKKELENGEIKELTEKEKAYLDKILFHENPGRIYSDVATEAMDKNALELARNNPNFHMQYGYIMPILEELEEKIPKNSRDNLYRNLETLQIDIPDYMNCTPAIDDQGGYGYYLAPENKIVINGEQLKRIYDITDGDKDAVDRMIMNVLRHEMDHMASTRYDKGKNIVRTGFLEIDMNSGEERGRALNEGYTMPINNSSYVFERSITAKVKALMEMMGKEERMKELYYSAAGPEALCREFAEGIKMPYGKVNKDGSHFAFGDYSMPDLMAAMDLQHNLERSEIEHIVSSIPHNIQNNLCQCLVATFKKQMDLAKTNEEREEAVKRANKCIQDFGKSFLVPDSIGGENFPGLEKTEEEFKEACDKMIKYYEFTQSQGKDMPVPDIADVNELDVTYYEYSGADSVSRPPKSVEIEGRSSLEQDVPQGIQKSEFTLLQQQITGYPDRKSYEIACERAATEWEAQKGEPRVEKLRDMSKDKNVAR